MPKQGQSQTVDLSALIRAADDAAIAEAGQLLASGALVAFPTETVYGLGADATNGEAVARIYEAKGRPRFNPLIIHVTGLEAAAELGRFSPPAEALARAFWPGPLTIVVPRREPSPISHLATCGLETIALRAPDHPVAQQILRAAGRPLAAPSANRSGRVSATMAEHVASDFDGGLAMILNGGRTRIGLESTVVSVISDQIALLRQGATKASDIEAAIGRRLTVSDVDAARPNAPGQLASHYAPSARVRLNAAGAGPGEAMLAFGASSTAPTSSTYNLSETGDLVEAASNLFAALRLLDQSGVDAIAVAPIPEVGLGQAINDRLRRAAAPRP
jgi:L-threonylcarbamoyladenylate synthase